MTDERPLIPSLISLRPLVRYVDEDRAVVDLWIQTLAPPRSAAPADAPAPPDAGDYSLMVRAIGPDESEFDYVAPLDRSAQEQLIRFEIVCPERWWPAGLGEQFLYELSVTLLAGDRPIDRWESALGLTSVRQGTPESAAAPAQGGRRRTPQGKKRHAMIFVVNGQPLLIRSVTPVGLAEERQVLPVTGDSLLVVRDHFGPSRLYDAADRAGILIVQSVPEDAVNHASWDAPAPGFSTPGIAAPPRQGVLADIDRLMPHPSLAGWFVGHLGARAQMVARRIHELDPTHPVLLRLPLAS